MTTPAAVHDIVEEYLGFRRKLGFELRIEGQELRGFARFAHEVGHTGPVTTQLAVRWATLPAEADRLYHARRLDMVRRLARHRVLVDPATEVPPEGLLGPSYRRRPPHIYSDQEVASLLRAAAGLGPTGGLRPQTYTTLFGLLAATGMRVAEALALRHRDVDLDASLITILSGKFRRARLVPLHPSAAEALRGYVDRRDRYRFRRVVSSNAFFLTEFGTALKYHKVLLTFLRLRDRLGWTTGRHGRPPRIHDLRHRFVACRLSRWYEEGVSVDHRMGSLSTYLGHVKVSDTYWYLTAVPELLALPAARFEQAVRTPREGL
jgi:integrase